MNIVVKGSVKLGKASASQWKVEGATYSPAGACSRICKLAPATGTTLEGAVFQQSFEFCFSLGLFFFSPSSQLKLSFKEVVCWAFESGCIFE